MKSLQSKFILLILGCVGLCVVVIGGAGVTNAQKVVDNDSTEIMNLHCKELANSLDNQLLRIEQSVETLSLYAAEQIDNIDHLTSDSNYLSEYIKKLSDLATNLASNTEGAVAIYARCNPEIFSSVEGVFLTKHGNSKNFQSTPLTDLSAYSPDDTEYVGWYYKPVANGKATWMAPYLNKNINVFMISYVIPIYVENNLLGVVGMDIDFDVVTNAVSNMKIYDSGYAFLIDEDANVMYHEGIEFGQNMSEFDPSLEPVTNELTKASSDNTLFSYHWQGSDKKMAFRSLENGMRLALSAPESEINEVRNGLVYQIIIATSWIVAIAVALTVYLTRRIVKPLRELNSAAMKIADGDLSISLSCKSNDEVGTLANSFQETVSHLQKYVNYINGLAYRDTMTGVKNKTAYDDVIKTIESKMIISKLKFAIIVFDVNGLKQVNDSYGHEVGDSLIIDACRIICGVFKKSSVYRIGGDEFVAIIEDADVDICQALLEQLDKNIDENNIKSNKPYQISIARGIATYNSDIDLIFSDVFKRADESMYRNKAKTKKLD